MRRFLLTILAACLLSGCGTGNTFSPTVVSVGGCSFPTIATKLLGKTWIGQLDNGSTTRLVRMVFSQSGCNVVTTGQCLIYNGTASPSYPGSGTIELQNFTAVNTPVTINGDQATFTPTFSVNNPTNNQTTIPSLGLLVVPGTSFTATFTVTITDNSLNGTYSTQQAAPASQQGNVFFTPETVPTANVSGHWTGIMSATTNQSVGAGTLDFTLTMNGNLIALASPGTLTTSEVTVKLNDPTGVSGVVIGNRVLFGVTWIRSSSQQLDHLQHRWFLGTINGNTITGEFSDIVNPQGQGTFTITRQ
jgi:hypothetical protein